MGLTQEQIDALLSKSRSSGYTEKQNEFLASGENGVCVNEQWPEFKDKKANTLKQGFEGAKTKKDAAEGADKIKVVVADDKVYLLNLATQAEAVEA